jgi:hypothetical protein
MQTFSCASSASVRRLRGEDELAHRLERSSVGAFADRRDEIVLQSMADVAGVLHQAHQRLAAADNALDDAPHQLQVARSGALVRNP